MDHAGPAPVLPAQDKRRVRRGDPQPPKVQRVGVRRPRGSPRPVTSDRSFPRRGHVRRGELPKVQRALQRQLGLDEAREGEAVRDTGPVLRAHPPRGRERGSEGEQQLEAGTAGLRERPALPPHGRVRAEGRPAQRALGRRPGKSPGDHRLLRRVAVRRAVGVRHRPPPPRRPSRAPPPARAVRAEDHVQEAALPVLLRGTRWLHEGQTAGPRQRERRPRPPQGPQDLLVPPRRRTARPAPGAQHEPVRGHTQALVVRRRAPGRLPLVVPVHRDNVRGRSSRPVLERVGLAPPLLVRRRPRPPRGLVGVLAARAAEVEERDGGDHPVALGREGLRDAEVRAGVLGRVRVDEGGVAEGSA